MSASSSSSACSSFFQWILISSFILRLSEGHGYLQTPRTRNRYAAEEGTNSPNPNVDGVPMKEYCAHCLNRKQVNEVCGIGQNGSYDTWKDANGKAMPWKSQEVYTEGQIFDVDVTLTTNHAGHMELYLCPNPSTTNDIKACLESNPIEMVGPAHGGPIDELYPQRGYFSNDYNHSFRYKLPNGIQGDQVLIQWRYITANSCLPPNYLNPNLGLNGLGWLRGNHSPCPQPYSETGIGVPEQFWNCAEVTIISASPTISPAPTNKPTTRAPVVVSEAPTGPTGAPGYCNWGHLDNPSNPCDGEAEGGDWCNESKERCETGCTGKWCFRNTSPTQSPNSGFPTKSPVEEEPTSSPVTKAPSVSGYCNWGHLRGSPCDGIVEGGDWCNFNENQCESGCSGKWCEGGGPPPPPSGNPPSPAPTNGDGVATTTRYWDCAGGACGCAYLPFGPGTDSEPAHCYSNAMFDAPSGNTYGAKFYGTAAISKGLGGGDWLAEGCGKCWKVTGTSNAPGYEGTQTTLVLKGTNYCPPANPMCSGNKPHFDISAPGFDVVEYSFNHYCPEREADEATGFAACGRWMIDSQDPDTGCYCDLFNDPILKGGCENFYSLKWDNPSVAYEEVTCPNELDRLNCWEENGNDYPNGIPEFCASNLDSSPTSPPTPVPTPTPGAPTSSPISAPTTSAPTPSGPSCEESDDDKFFKKTKNGGVLKDCAWLKGLKNGQKKRLCKKPTRGMNHGPAGDVCIKTCDKFKRFRLNKKKMKTCAWLKKRNNTKALCAKKKKARETCFDTCGTCPSNSIFQHE